MVLDASFLNTQHYKVRIKYKVEQSKNGSEPYPTLDVVDIEIKAFESPSTTVASFTYFFSFSLSNNVSVKVSLVRFVLKQPLFLIRVKSYNILITKRKCLFSIENK